MDANPVHSIQILSACGSACKRRNSPPHLSQPGRWTGWVPSPANVPVWQRLPSLGCHPGRCRTHQSRLPPVSGRYAARACILVQEVAGGAGLSQEAGFVDLQTPDARSGSQRRRLQQQVVDSPARERASARPSEAKPSCKYVHVFGCAAARERRAYIR